MAPVSNAYAHLGLRGSSPTLHHLKPWAISFVVVQDLDLLYPLFVPLDISYAETIHARQQLNRV